ncbi:hypothetical protein Sango_2870900 [Sesamum angolense]|uniref:DUF7081 domain-containing protein n=1 Tax=Sesamum angolense TaxID=2727404 RepID=A0AAE1T760_9LAMI|nr:hypothetical protein Sango_2870900 [Sesamum angolense]
MLIFLYLLDPLEHANSTGLMDVDVSDSANGGSNWMSKDGSFLRPPVQPGESGEGLPYAPADWPNAGDIWTWKVGNKISASGYYTHRFLIAPKRLQKSPTRKLWLGSKPSIIRFLQSEFAEADIDTFFASFTWEIPAERRSVRKARKRPPSRRGTTAAESGGQRTRNSARKLTYLTDQDTTTSMNPPLSKRVSADVLSSHTTANENDKACDPDIAVCPVQNPAGWSTRGCRPQDPNSRADHLTEMTTDGFDSYLNSLDEVLSQSVPRAPNSGSALSEMEDFKKAREELSSLIAIDFPSLITSNKLPEVTNLSSKLQSDPHLSPKELSMLNLIQEIPSASRCFLDAKQVTAEANKFFMELEANKGLITALKRKYMLSKDKIALLQAEDVAASSTIQEIDDEIAILQSRRATLAKVVKRNQEKIAELASAQKRVSDSIPKIVNEVQMANSERSEWELKQKQAAKQEAEILMKFGPVERTDRDVALFLLTLPSSMGSA